MSVTLILKKSIKNVSVLGDSHSKIQLRWVRGWEAVAFNIYVIFVFNHETNSRQLVSLFLSFFLTLRTIQNNINVDFFIILLAPCPEDYTEFSYDHRDICLRYRPEVKSYPEATTECQAEGGDLIKVDSQRKMDIFKDFVCKSSAP